LPAFFGFGERLPFQPFNRCIIHSHIPPFSVRN
jgi:hypothetical protein